MGGWWRVGEGIPSITFNLVSVRGQGIYMAYGTQLRIKDQRVDGRKTICHPQKGHSLRVFKILNSLEL